MNVVLKLIDAFQLNENRPASMIVLKPLNAHAKYRYSPSMPLPSPTSSFGEQKPSEEVLNYILQRFNLTEGALDLIDRHYNELRKEVKNKSRKDQKSNGTPLVPQRLAPDQDKCIVDSSPPTHPKAMKETNELTSETLNSNCKGIFDDVVCKDEDRLDGYLPQVISESNVFADVNEVLTSPADISAFVSPIESTVDPYGICANSEAIWKSLEYQKSLQKWHQVEKMLADKRAKQEMEAIQERLHYINIQQGSRPNMAPPKQQTASYTCLKSSDPFYLHQSQTRYADVGYRNNLNVLNHENQAPVQNFTRSDPTNYLSNMGRCANSVQPRPPPPHNFLYRQNCSPSWCFQMPVMTTQVITPSTYYTNSSPQMGYDPSRIPRSNLANTQPHSSPWSFGAFPSPNPLESSYGAASPLNISPPYFGDTSLRSSGHVPLGTTAKLDWSGNEVTDMSSSVLTSFMSALNSSLTNPKLVPVNHDVKYRTLRASFQALET